jgi:2-oxoglutarate/2-oxoacid ferredoxin oxidoreductase subunit beta
VLHPRLDSTDFRHLPIGLFRQVQQPSYDQLMADQLQAARAQADPGELAALLVGTGAWEIG